MAPTPLPRFADDVWLDTAPVRILGMKLTATMAAIRLDDGALVLVSPLAATPERRAAIEALGAVAHLYAPNTYHHTWLGDWTDAYPSARVHAPAGLADKRPDLRIDRVHASAPEPAFARRVVELPVAGFALAETALVHLPSRTLFVADLVHNVGRPAHAWTRIYTSIMGFHDRVAISRVIRWGFRDRAAGRRSLDAILEQPFDRIVVGHGAPVEVDAKRALADAYAWL